MSSGSAVLPTDVEHPDYLNADVNSPKTSECSLERGSDEKQECEEQDEDEEEDLDFNPFLKETPSMEASSSLSSETEGLDANVVDSGGSNSISMVNTLLLKAPNQVEDCSVGDGNRGEEILMQTTSGGGTNRTAGLVQEKIFFLISESENETGIGKDNVSSSGTEVVNDVEIGDLATASISTNSGMDIDDEDAICRRTRARYSLASFTLDELETFLQETDDEEDLQNVDDEEEYRKFLAAVLHDGDADHFTEQESENIDDEDEDNDADFELEIEEALESDVDENLMGQTQEENYELGGRRPETRQNKRQKVSGCLKRKSSEHLNRPLRPLLPNVPALPFPTAQGKNMMFESAPPFLSSPVYSGFVNGFTPHQLGQLHCLIHEHVQLLIQVYSLCIFEPSKENIASQVQGLFSEILNKRNQVLAWRKVPYPSFCFYPPYVHPSVSDDSQINLTSQKTFQSSPIYASQRDCSIGNNIAVPSDNVHPCNVRNQSVSSGRGVHCQAAEGPFWVPFVNGQVLSILDVAPLNTVGSYIEEVCSAVQEYKRRRLGDIRDDRFEKEPLFPLRSPLSSAEANGEVSRDSQAFNSVPSSESDQGRKRTLAGALVERTKLQSVAFVPKKIANLAQRFFPMFNPALYPHKPPPASVANRVLFTDAEDMLLASGLMEYNTDWKAIQQHFLPCKSKHQIFVRQKNRSCSRAPENPIKAVRRFKTSPLTAEETARIREGLKIYKLDWMSLWKFIVPYRDPSLLPRQWRIANGTQKSYKADMHTKEKRRLYESRRRKCKPANLGRWQSESEKEDSSAGGENNSGDECMGNENEAYVHEAFLADWRPGTSSVSHTEEQRNSSSCGDLEPQIGHHFSAPSKNSHSPASSHFAHARSCATSSQLNNPFSDVMWKSSKSQLSLPRYQARRNSTARLVKLAPDLPPVNLPPSVRVMSQSAFKNYQGGASNNVFGSHGVSGPVKSSTVPKVICVSKSATCDPVKVGQDNSNLLKTSMSHLCPKESVLRNELATQEDESALHMHPLLFQPPEDGRLPYSPLNCSTNASSSFNLFQRNHPLLNLSLLHNPKQANYTNNFSHNSLKTKEKSSPSFSIDFHPLLQRSDDVNSNTVTACSTAQRAPAELLASKPAHRHESSDAILTKKSDPVCNLAIPSSPGRKTNELDLGIHLSFTSRKQISEESRDVIGQDLTGDLASIQDSGIVQSGANLLKHQSGSSSRIIPVDNGDDSGVHVIDKPNNDVEKNAVDITTNQSLPEIVMEQEELSDSDEEISEHVEFECEEMTDSEGEDGSDCEQIGSIVIEDMFNIAVGKAARDTDCNDRRHEPVPLGKPEYNGVTSEGCKKLCAEDQDKDNSCNSLCLNLNSSPAAYAGVMKSKQHSVVKNQTGSTNGNQLTSRWNRSCKYASLKTEHVTPQKPGIDKPQPTNFDSPAVTPSKKPRKRARGTSFSLCAEQSKEGDESCNAGLGVDILNPVNNNDRS